MRQDRWRTWGAVVLAASTVATVLAIVETALSDRWVHAKPLDYLYGINLHLLVVMVIGSAVGLLAPRAQPRRMVLLTLGGLLALEGALVGSYWVGTIPGFPRFYTVGGKLATAGAAIVLGAAGAALGAWLRRFPGEYGWDRLSRSIAGPLGLCLFAMVLVGNGVLAFSQWPRTPRFTIRPDAHDRARPDVIIILVDTLRRDHLSSFGYPRPTSAVLDRLFAQSYLFTQAYTPSTWTMPTVASLFTGLYPTSHRAVTAFHALPEGVPTLAEHFRSYGYQTGAFVGNRGLSQGNGFSQGFQYFYPPNPPWWCHGMRTAFERVAKQLTRSATAEMGWMLNAKVRDWLADTRGQPRLAYVHYIEPHSPYAAPEANRQAVAPDAPPGPEDPPLFRDHRRALEEADCNDWGCVAEPPQLPPPQFEGMVANYDGEVHRVDQLAGRLLRILEEEGLLDRCHLIFCTDHGEEFFDHQGWFHGNSIYEEMTACPLAYRPPGGVPGGARIDRPVAELDLLRTLCTLVGIDAPPLHQGLEIPELLGLPAPAVAAPVLSELPPHLYSLRHRDWKLVRRGPRDAPQWLLFDLSEDPREQRDLSAVVPDTLRILRGWLEDIVAAHARAAVEREAIADDPEALRQLRDLGYIK